MVTRIDAHFAQHGFGFWAAELKATGEFTGFVGLAVPSFTAHFTPCVEIGWRLAFEHWGRGFATEGARAALAFGIIIRSRGSFMRLVRAQSTATASHGSMSSSTTVTRLTMLTDANTASTTRRAWSGSGAASCTTTSVRPAPASVTATSPTFGATALMALCRPAAIGSAARYMCSR